jgi:hypothetical protein
MLISTFNSRFGIFISSARGAREKAVFRIILFTRAQFAHKVFDDVIVRQHETVGETNDPEPPLLNLTAAICTLCSHSSVMFEAIFAFDFRARHVVERPHAFVRERGELKCL